MGGFIYSNVAKDAFEGIKFEKKTLGEERMVKSRKHILLILLVVWLLCLCSVCCNEEPVIRDEIYRLAKELKDESPLKRIAAAHALGYYGPKAKAAVPDLINALRDENVLVHDTVAATLASIGPDIVQILINALEDENPGVRSGVVWALGCNGPEALSSVPYIIDLMRDDDAIVRRNSARALGDIGPCAKDGIPVLINALNDEWSEVRIAAAGSIARIGPHVEEAAPFLIKALQDPDKEVRFYVACALAKFEGEAKEAVPTLVEALDYEGLAPPKLKYIRSAAIMTLGEIGPDASAALPRLAELLSNEGYREIHLLIQEAMLKINPDLSNDDYY